MRSFVTMWRKIFDYKGKTRVSEFLLALIFNAFIGFFLSFVLRSFVGETLAITFLTGYVFCSIFPITSMIVRRVRDTERSLNNLLWVFIPIVGWAILFFLLLSRSQAQRDKEFDRYHW